MVEIQRFTPVDSIDKMLEAIREDGAIIVEGMIDISLVDEVMAELDPYIQATPTGPDSFTGVHTTRTGAIVARSTASHKLVGHPAVLEAANKFLEPFCERIQLHLAQVIRIMPGQVKQAIHRDRWAWGTHLSNVEPQFNTIWAMTDFTETNGATQVVPGSLDWPDKQRAEADQITQAIMPKGSVLLYTGGVFHGGGENNSDNDRVGLNITYTLGWLRQEENQYLSCPPEIAKDLPKPLQDLLGYTMGSYAMGYYTPPLAAGEGPEMTDPSYALDGNRDNIGMGDASLLDSLNKQVAESTDN